MKLYIVEDNIILLQSLHILLQGEPDIEVTGTFESAQHALRALKKSEGDINVLLTDLGLPDMQGDQFIYEVKRYFPQILIIVNTICEESQAVFNAIRAGASGYMLKGSSPRELIEALYELYEGGAPMSPRIAKKVIGEFQNNQFEESYLLSSREQEVLKLIEQGYSYTECATSLCISRHTVNSHIKKIYQKLHAQNKSEALLRAKQKGIL